MQLFAFNELRCGYAAAFISIGELKRTAHYYILIYMMNITGYYFIKCAYILTT